MGGDAGHVGGVVLADVLVVGEQQVADVEDGVVGDLRVAQSLLDLRPDLTVQLEVLRPALGPDSDDERMPLDATSLGGHDATERVGRSMCGPLTASRVTV